MGAKVLIALAAFPIHKSAGQRKIQDRVVCRYVVHV